MLRYKSSHVCGLVNDILRVFLNNKIIFTSIAYVMCISHIQNFHHSSWCKARKTNITKLVSKIIVFHPS